MVARVSASLSSPLPVKPAADEAASSSLQNSIAEVRNDPSKACFLDEGRTPADHVGIAVREGRVAAALVDAQAASAKLSAAVREDVILQKEALLAEVDAVAALEKEVTTVESGVESLATASGALADALAIPYAPMTRAVAKLKNVHAASAILRAVSRFHACTQKLADAALFPTFSPAVRTSPESLPSAAEAVRELEELLGSKSDRQAVASAQNALYVEAPVRLDKIDVVSKHIPGVRKSANELRRRVTALLKSSLSSRDQDTMTAAILSFHALGVLPDRINAEVGRMLSETQSAVQRGLEYRKSAAPTGLTFPSAFVGGRNRLSQNGASGTTSNMGGNGSGGTLGRVPGAENVSDSSSADGLGTGSGQGGGAGSDTEIAREVWTRFESMLDTIRDACFKAILLQQVLSRKYDDVTHVSLLHEPIASGFIDAVAKSLGEQLSLLARTHRQRASAGEVFRALAGEYPRLRMSLMTLSLRVYTLIRSSPHPITSFQQSRTPAVSHLPIVPGSSFVQEAFLSSSLDVETHYLSASLERVTGAVSAAFESSRSAPGETEALSLARVFASELAASRSDNDLFATAVTNVATALRIYASNAEDYAASKHPQSSSSGGGRSGPVIVREWPLSHMYNGLVALTTASKRVLGSGLEGGGPVPLPIGKEIKAMTALSDKLLHRLFEACTGRVCRAMESMHTEDLSGHSGSDDGCSIYAVNVTAQLSMFAEGVIQVLARTRSLGVSTVTLGKGVLDMFVRNASLAFPLPDGARLRLATDMARIELAVESLCPVRMLGESYLAIRAFRRLVFMTDIELTGPLSQEVLEPISALPPSIVAFHLFSRSRDVDFVHPHRAQDVAPAEFSNWLASNTEKEAWKSVQDVIETYETSPRGSPCVEYRALKSLGDVLCEKWEARACDSDW